MKPLFRDIFRMNGVVPMSLAWMIAGLVMGKPELHFHVLCIWRFQSN